MRAACLAEMFAKRPHTEKVWGLFSASAVLSEAGSSGEASSSKPLKKGAVERLLMGKLIFFTRVRGTVLLSVAEALRRG